jgi:hypothetical protein
MGEFLHQSAIEPGRLSTPAANWMQPSHEETPHSFERSLRQIVAAAQLALQERQDARCCPDPILSLFDQNQSTC